MSKLNDKKNRELSDGLALKILESFKDLLDSARCKTLEHVFNRDLLQSENPTFHIFLRNQGDQRLFVIHHIGL